ncbi:MAG: thioredoxin domain-containing protein, partial [Nitrospinae bacterium]|nr:thioredoxin domain-containing protein [Nitrospinota bacterium]
MTSRQSRVRTVSEATTVFPAESSSGGSSGGNLKAEVAKAPTPAPAPQAPPAAPSAKVVKPLAANAHIRGNPNATITIMEWSDFQCPFCKGINKQAMRYFRIAFIPLVKFEHIAEESIGIGIPYPSRIKDVIPRVSTFRFVRVEN